MMRRHWNVEYQREVVALRTALAYPEGTTPYLQERAVLDDVIGAYAQVWQHVVELDRSLQKTKTLPRLFLCRPSLTDRTPLSLYRIFIRLGRQELTEREAISEIECLFSWLN